MKKIEKNAKNFDKIIAIGDIHGRFREFGHKIKSKNIENSILLLCGDVGFGFHKPNYYINEMQRLNDILVENNILLFAVRGNHDDPEYFNGNWIFFSNIYLVPDYYLLETMYKKILFIGGSISIDRIYRTHSVDYWINEYPIFNEKKLDIDNVDIIITHTAPSFVYPYTKDGIKNWLTLDPLLDHDTNSERYTMNNIWDYLEVNNKLPEYWVYGHFHSSKTTIIGQTKFKLIDELEFLQLF